MLLAMRTKKLTCEIDVTFEPTNEPTSIHLEKCSLGQFDKELTWLQVPSLGSLTFTVDSLSFLYIFVIAARLLRSEQVYRGHHIPYKES